MAMYSEEDRYQLSWKAYRNNQNAMEYAFKKAKSEGEQQGQYKALVEMVRRMKQINLTVEQIMQATELTREEIEKLSRISLPWPKNNTNMNRRPRIWHDITI